MVGATGFEPATSCSRSRRATGLRYAPPTLLVNEPSDAPGESRTPNLLIRSQMLYPVELRAPNESSDAPCAQKNVRSETDLKAISQPPQNQSRHGLRTTSNPHPSRANRSETTIADPAAENDMAGDASRLRTWA